MGNDGGEREGGGERADNVGGYAVCAAAHEAVVEQDAGVEEQEHEAGDDVVAGVCYGVHKDNEEGAGGDCDEDARVCVGVGAVDDKRRERGDGAGEQCDHGAGFAVGEGLRDGEIGVVYRGPAGKIGADAEKEGEEDAGRNGERFGRSVGWCGHWDTTVTEATVYIVHAVTANE